MGKCSERNEDDVHDKRIIYTDVIYTDGWMDGWMNGWMDTWERRMDVDPD
jgi:hypothetical protein